MSSVESIAYYKQKQKAKTRGIHWRFTFRQWCAWWEAELGPDWFEKRGKTYGKYCMARFGDSGPYSPSNVKCILHTENTLEADQSKKITRNDARAIFLSDERYPILAKRYAIDRSTVSLIKNRRIWRNATIDL